MKFQLKPINVRRAAPIWAVFGVVGALSCYGFWFIGAIGFAEGVSMEPTIHPGALFLMLRYTDASPPIRGEIAISSIPPAVYEMPRYSHLRNHPPQITLMKRIVGIPGDQFEIQGKSQIIPPRQYALEGDNHAKSLDSRVFGTVPFQALIGRVVFVLNLPWAASATPQ
jgi:type IV secretory pathway protease TraF